MVADWRKKMIREALDNLADVNAKHYHSSVFELDLQRIVALLEADEFDQPSPMDEHEVEINKLTDGSEPEFKLTVTFLVGEDWVDATGKGTCVCDALGELSWDIEQQRNKELARQAKYAERMVALEEVAV